MRKWLIGLVVVLLGAVGMALAYAPYLPQLVLEGYPPLIAPERGNFALLLGAAEPRDLGAAAGLASAEFASDLDAQFVNSGGTAFLVYRDGRLALEHYGQGISATTRLNSFSMVKTLVGALLYKALAEGRLADFNVTLGQFFPDAPHIGSVSLQSLLTMRSGIAFEAGGLIGASGQKTEVTPSPFSPMAALHFAGLPAILGRLAADGTVEHPFSYQNANTALLGAVLEQLYQRPLAELLDEKIWRPAGAGEAQWRQPGAGEPVSAYCCLYATARDFVRIGVFLSENGTPGEPFLPEALWREFLGFDVPYEARAHGHYGNHVLQDVLDRPGEPLQGPFTYLFGQNGQTMYLMPERRLVVFRSGQHEQLLHSALYAAWRATE